MAGIDIKVGANFDPADIEKSLAQLQQRVNAIGQQIAQANKVKFTPVDKGAIDDLNKFSQRFEQFVRIQGGLRQRMRATGQENVGFLDLNWSKLYSDSTAAVRAQQKAFEYVTGQTFGPREQGSNSGPQGASQSGAPNRVKSGLTEALSSTARAGLGAAGPVGGVAASALGTGISAGFGAGLMGLIGGLAALAVGKAVSAVREQIGAAEQESIRYADLKRTLGDVGVSFKTLRESVHASAMALSVNYDESQRLASAFAKMSNGLTSAGAIGSEVAIGGGIGRAYGLDPSAGVAFNAQMRRFGATSDEQGSRRMALLVGETIARASGFAQAGEILQAIASYTEQQTRLGLSTANVPAYAGYMSALVGSGIPGMDAKGAASLLGIVNSSVQRGGDEAVQMFYGHLGRSMGITDPIMMAYLREQGAFTTGAEAFNNQVFKDFAGRHGISMPDMSGEQGPFIQRVLDALRGQFAGDPFGMLNAMQRAFPGISLSQGMALDGMSPDMIGGILDSLSRLDIDMNSVSGSSIGLLGKVHAGDRNALMEVAQNLAGRTGSNAISFAEQSALQAAADGGNDDQLRELLTSLVAKYGREETEGDKVRSTIVGVENRLRDFATAMIPLTTDIRHGIIFLAGGGGKRSSNDIREAVLRSDSVARIDGLRATTDREIEKEREAIKAALDEEHALNRQQWEEARQNGGLSPDRAEWYGGQRERLRSDVSSHQQRIISLEKEKNDAIKDEKKAVEARIESMRDAERKRLEAEDARIAAINEATRLEEQNNELKARSLDERFPMTGQPRYNSGPSGASGPAVSVVPQAGHVVNSGLSNVRGFRNNNPGNIEAGIGFKGEIGSDGRFAKFSTPEMGYRALGVNLMTYQRKYGLNTVRGIINRWAPPGENKTGAYIASVSKQLGVSPDSPLNLQQEETLYGLVKAITHHENGGLLHSEETMRTGVGMATGSTPIPQIGGATAKRGSDVPSVTSMTGTLSLDMRGDVTSLFKQPDPIQVQFGPPIPSGAR